ncbi:hypothetical protein A4X09_0g5913 [Tilletia walkeri]|uniref:IMD domain-containing protein n=1 Tax=Tilletia walkeri TaxID=117179 RepID=A0A8X7N6A5_9BASI|nr:hypothetical protein A4X09_0g5913 [Tilletia walkeri]
MPGPRSFRSVAHSHSGGTGGGPPSPTLSATTRASFDFPSRPSVLVTRADLRSSLSAYEGLLSAAKGYTNVMLTMAQASAELASALETCARVKGAHESGAGLHASSALHFLMSNYQQVLADSLWKDFSIPLLSHFDTYRSGVAERQVAHEQEISAKSKVLKETEARNMRTGRRKERDLGSFRRALAELQSQVDSLDELKAQYYHEVIENEEEVWEYILSKVSLIVRSQLEVAERVASKGSSDPVLEPMLASIPDPFDSYGPPKQDDQIFSILPPTSLLSSSTVMPSPGIGPAGASHHQHHHQHHHHSHMTPSGSSSTLTAESSTSAQQHSSSSRTSPATAIMHHHGSASGYASPSAAASSSSSSMENGTATVGSLLGLHSVLGTSSGGAAGVGGGGPGAGRLFGDDTLDEDDVLLGGGGGGGSVQQSHPNGGGGGRLKKALSIINEDIHIVPLDHDQQQPAGGGGGAGQRRISAQNNQKDDSKDFVTESTPTQSVKKNKKKKSSLSAEKTVPVASSDDEDEDDTSISHLQTKSKKGKDTSLTRGEDEEEEDDDSEDERVAGSANASQGGVDRIKEEGLPQDDLQEQDGEDSVHAEGSPPRRRKGGSKKRAAAVTKESSTVQSDEER